MDAFGDMPASSDGMSIVARARARWGHAKPGTLLRVLAQLRAVLKVAERDGLIPRAPHLQMPHVHDVVDCPISPDEARLLLDYMKLAEPRWYPLALLLAHTGARLGEAMAVTSGDVTELGVRLRKPTARRSKTIDRVVPLTSTLRRSWERGELDGLLSMAPLESRALRSLDAQLGRAIKGACRSLGLPEIRVHDLRHVFAAMVAERGGDLADIASLLGHSNIKTTMRYRGLVRSRAQSMLESL